MINELYFKENPFTQLIENYKTLSKQINRCIQYA